MTLRVRALALPCAAAAAWLLAAHPVLATDKNEARAVGTRLSSYEEVPAVSSKGNGRFKAFIDKATGEVDYEFSYGDMQGTVTQAHIHFGQRGVNGGIAVWLCQSATNPAPAAVAATTPECASPAAVFTGRITANSIVGPGGAQQLGAGELAEFAAALRAGAAYVNVHTNLSPGGEVRGQIRPGHHHHH